MKATRHQDALKDSLARGSQLLPRRLRRHHGRYVTASMAADGSFSGRAGGADAYYTAFGLKAASLAGVDDDGFWSRAGEWLARQGAPQGNTWEIADLYSLLAAWHVTCEHLDADGDGQASLQRRARERLSSPGEPCIYDTYLAMLSWDLLDEDMPGLEASAERIRGLQLADGSFSDSLDGPAGGGTNPTAAAVSVLARSKTGIDEDAAEGAAEFIGSMQRPGGGFAAHGKAPCPDLLSTFTGLMTIALLDRAGPVGLGDVARFVRKCACGTGGFGATTDDGGADVEYTFYGLGTLSMLAAIAKSAGCC